MSGLFGVLVAVMIFSAGIAQAAAPKPLKVSITVNVTSNTAVSSYWNNWALQGWGAVPCGYDPSLYKSRPLVYFNLSTIPQDATITKATLRVPCPGASQFNGSIASRHPGPMTRQLAIRAVMELTGFTAT